MLNIKKITASIAGEKILKGLDLAIQPGEIHAIMGPNGSGKSTLANILVGRKEYQINEGGILYKGIDLTELSPEQRAREGIFLAFQYPTEIPEVTNAYLIKNAVNAIRRHQGKDELDAFDFLNLVKEKLRLVDLDEDFLNRSVNEGFSGGEKKRNEMLQMAMLEPTIAILDEIDSGLDIDSLEIIANVMNNLRDSSKSVILITHYQRLLNHIKPDYVHVLSGGKIVKSGGFELALQLEEKGYSWLHEKTNTA